MSGVFGFSVSANAMNSGGFRDNGPQEEKSTRDRMHIRFLESNLAKALLINEALWELISEKLNISEEQFHEKLYEIDMRDGVLDGKNQRNIIECPKCHRKVASKHLSCLYCGQILDNSVFQMTQ